LEYSHSDIRKPATDNSFKAGIVLNIGVVAAELIFGLMSNSISLISDAGHNFSDVLTLVFSWIAVKLSLREPTMKFTYGFRRSTILMALVNTFILLAGIVAILWATIMRLRHPVPVNSLNIIIVAGIGIIINGLTAMFFMKGQKTDLNLRSAFIHFVTDALVSFGVVVTGIAIYFTKLYWLDAAVSIIIMAVIIYSAYRLLIDSVNLALDAVPENINIRDVRRYLEGLPEVSELHDLHIWAMSTTDAALTVHLSTRVQTDVGFITKIREQLQARFNIDHTTIQIEYRINPAENDKHDI
jgi:cobalt-zinc-cadmium efflux system protein